MAEGTSSQDKVVCRFFLAGLCNDGEHCLFSHDPSGQIPDSVCRYHLHGRCIFGVNCRYDHILMNEVRTLENNSINKITSADLSKCSFSSKSTAAASWINENAPVFVPKHCRSYADTVKANAVLNKSERPSEEICPFFAEGNCPFPDCMLVHGYACELCHKSCLHPFNEEARKTHIEKCEKEMEENIKFSFAMQRSLTEICGICMDVVLEKEPISERRFGILENCNHVYCLSCIRKWRRSRQYESNEMLESMLDPENVRACPECRKGSAFIIPSSYFVDTVEEKQALITEYKTALSKKHCKYFKRGEGICPFGGACFYLHAKTDGTVVDLPVPTRRCRQNMAGEIDFIDVISLWDYLEHRGENGVSWIISNESSDASD